MSKTSIILPVRNELFLKETIGSLYKTATGDFEVIIVLDGYWPDPPIEDRDNLTIIHLGKRLGMRAAINMGACVAKGDFLLKCDGHVLFQEGFNELLAQDCDGDWVVNPTRYSLDAETWDIRRDHSHPPVYYEYLSYPISGNDVVGLHAHYWWRERDKARAAYKIDENMCWQGSCWFMPTKYFMNLIYPMDEANYGMFIGEPQEIGLKVWLSGGKNMLNKNVWYAHMWKGKGYRELHRQKMGFEYTRVSNQELIKGNMYSTDFWFNNRWSQRVHDLGWLIEKFWPVPTWPEDRFLWTNITIDNYKKPGH